MDNDLPAETMVRVLITAEGSSPEDARARGMAHLAAISAALVRGASPSCFEPGSCAEVTAPPYTILFGACGGSDCTAEGWPDQPSAVPMTARINPCCCARPHRQSSTQEDAGGTP